MKPSSPSEPSNKQVRKATRARQREARKVARAQMTLVEHLKGRTDDYCVEYRVRHADGRWLWVEDRGRAVELCVPSSAA